MSLDAQLEALQWQVLQSKSSSAKMWTELAKTTSLSSSFPDPTAKAVAVTVVYERAVRALPYSYKLWTQYVAFRRDDTRALCSANEWFQSVRDVYERALDKLPQMPLLWVSYLEFVVTFPLLRATMVRHLVGRSLVALPATQHHLIWKLVKRWTADPAVPRATFRQLWSVYLQLDTSTAARRQYFALLQRRGDTGEYVCECARLVAETAAKADPSPADLRLFEDTAFWEPLLQAFQSPGWFLDEAHTAAARTETLDTLEALVTHGRRFCASAQSLELAYAAFLCGQGHISKGRMALAAMLDAAQDAQTFAEIFRIAVEMEDQVVESFGLSEAARSLREHDREAYMAVVQELFGSADPCAHLSQLVRQYPLLLNQAQLRSHPRCVPLWLKRAELLQERIYASLATTADLVALYQQAIAQCTSDFETVDAAAAQLYQSHALLLCSLGRTKEATDVLHEAAWHVPFSSAAANAVLLGLLVEVRVLAGTPSHDIAAALLRTVSAAAAPSTGGTALASGVAARRRRGALLASLGAAGVDSAGGAAVAPTSLLARDARPWLLLADLSGNTEAVLSAAAQQHSHSPAFTAEGAAHFAFAYWWRLRDAAAATREFEKAMTKCRSEPMATLFLVQQYASFLCLSHADAPASAFPLHRFRELFRVVEAVLPAALQRAPAAALDFVVSCAFIERWRGLYGAAVRLLQNAAEVAVTHLDPAEHLALLFAVVEKAIRCTQLFKGCPGTRQFCGALLRSTGHAPLLQRIALHWAAIERRCGNREQAYAVLDACGDSQNPASPHGAVYWKLWESLCADIEDFEGLVRRRQQVEVRFHKRQAKSAVATPL